MTVMESSYIRLYGDAKTMAEGSGNSIRAIRSQYSKHEFQDNSGPFDRLARRLFVVGNDIAATFAGNSFDILGNGDGPGLATIDTNPSDGIHTGRYAEGSYNKT